jgi:hypothetical protein
MRFGIYPFGLLLLLINIVGEVPSLEELKKTDSKINCSKKTVVNLPGIKYHMVCMSIEDKK